MVYRNFPLTGIRCLMKVLRWTFHILTFGTSENFLQHLLIRTFFECDGDEGVLGVVDVSPPIFPFLYLGVPVTLLSSVTVAWKHSTYHRWHNYLGFYDSSFTYHSVHCFNVTSKRFSQGWSILVHRDLVHPRFRLILF